MFWSVLKKQKFYHCDWRSGLLNRVTVCWVKTKRAPFAKFPVSSNQNHIKSQNTKINIQIPDFPRNFRHKSRSKNGAKNLESLSSGPEAWVCSLVTTYQEKKNENHDFEFELTAFLFQKAGKYDWFINYRALETK